MKMIRLLIFGPTGSMGRLVTKHTNGFNFKGERKDLYFMLYH